MIRMSNSSRCIIVALFCSAAALGQVVTGTIVGTVKDSTGAAVAQATVTITNTDENVVARSFRTNASGEYTAPLLPVGHYAVTAGAPNFKTSKQTNIALDVNANVAVNLVLHVGNARETVTVNEAPTEVDTESPQSQTVIGSAQINELAISTRNYEQLVTLMPGVSTGLASDQLYVGVSSPVGTSNQINFSINGDRPTQNAWNVDGADNLDRGSNLTLLGYPSVDAIQEFSVQRGQFGAEYGRGSSGQVNVITKSGTNGFHGDLYEFFRNDDMAANNYINNIDALPRPPLRYNDFGGTIGGPIFKDKTFFFFSEEVRRVITYTTFLPIVPTAAERAGIFPAPVCLNPSCSLTGTHVTTIDPAAHAYLTDIIDKLPLPNDPKCTSGCTAANTGRNIFNFHQEIVRIDQIFGPKLRLFGRFENDTIPTIEPGGLFTGSALPGVSTTSTNAPGRIAMVHVDDSISSTLLNDLGFNYSHGGISSNPTGLDAGTNSPDVMSAVKLPYTNTLGRVPDLNFSNFSPITGFGPYRDYNDDYNAFDNLTKILGRHSLKLGVSYHWYQKSEDAARGNQGDFYFPTTLPTTDPSTDSQEWAEFAAFLEGNVFLFAQTSLDYRAVIRQQQFEFYGQDQFRFRPNLTLTYGVRYSLFRAPTDANNNLSNFDPAVFKLSTAQQIDPCTGNLGIQIGTCANPNVLPPTGNPLDGVIFGAKGSPYGNAITRQNDLDFAPRLGFAWDPFKTGKTSVRGGYGIYFDSPTIGQFESTIFDNPPLVTDKLIFDTTLDNPASVVPFVGSAPSPLEAVGPNFKQPYTEQFSLDVQREVLPRTFVDIGYYGNVGRHLLGVEDINQPLPGAYVTKLAPYGVTPPVTFTTTPQLNYIRPYRGYDAINSQQTLFSSNYNGLQVSAGRKIGTNSFLKVNYTYSHGLTDATADYTTPQNTYDIASEYGPTQFDRRQILNINFVYNLPFFAKQPGVEGHVLGGWEFSGIVTAFTGLPYSIYQFDEDPAGQGVIDGNSFASGRPDIVGNPNAAGPVAANASCAAPTQIHNFDAWFNPCAFNLVPTNEARPGDSPNGVVRGPGVERWDLSLFKNTRISERVNTQFRAEAFNTFNHVNLDVPDNVFGSGLGQITSARDPRILQLAMKLYF